MTILRNFGEVVFHCDGQGCHEVFETENRNWQVALELFQASDWIVRFIAGQAAHICPDCQLAESPPDAKLPN